MNVLDPDELEKAMVIKVANAYDLETLYKIREKIKSENKDLDLIDKAIKKKLEIESNNKTRLEQEDKKFKKSMKKAAFTGLLSGLFSSKNKTNKSDLSDWEVHEINKGNYEPMNFEEENMDKDDFYSDDLD